MRWRFLRVLRNLWCPRLRCVGWDVLYLEYAVDAPLSAVVTRDCERQYRDASRLFLRMRKALLLLDAAGNALAWAHDRVQRMLVASQEAAVTSTSARLSAGPGALPMQRRGGSTGAGPARSTRGSVAGSEGALAAHVRSEALAVRQGSKWEVPLRLGEYLHRCAARTLQGLHEFLMLGVVAPAWHHFQQDVEVGAPQADALFPAPSLMGFSSGCFAPTAWLL